MAIPRIRADKCHDVVCVGDPDVTPKDPTASGWVPATDATVRPGADIVLLHPLNGPDMRHGIGAGIELGDRRKLDLGGRDKVVLSAAVVRVNQLDGAAALEDLWQFPGSMLGDLADYVCEISNPIDDVAAKDAEGAPSGAPKSTAADGG